MTYGNFIMDLSFKYFLPTAVLVSMLVLSGVVIAGILTIIGEVHDHLCLRKKRKK